MKEVVYCPGYCDFAVSLIDKLDTPRIERLRLMRIIRSTMRSLHLGIAALTIGLLSMFATASYGGTYGFDFVGPGVSGHVNLTYGPTTDGTYSQAYEVTGISGIFTDTNNGLNIVNAAITGLAPLNVSSPEPTNYLAPANFSKFSIAVGSAFGDFSYDNLFWPTGSVQTASDYSAHGGFLDIYGLLFTIDGGYTVNFWSNGDSGSGVDYGVGVATSAQQYDYVSGGVAALVPEIDVAGMGSVLAIVTGILGLLERRRLKAT